ncbi:MAG: nitrogenase cofactor biosynthesis protein NifB [Chloroflexi bacterium]|nr:nitrogenase cofactor biosynthesis protein NifB [Chloroflexota bacterium]
MRVESAVSKVAKHPCYSTVAHFTFGRIHVPVAKKCNIQCGYCIRKFDCPNENRPGVTTQIISPETAISTIRKALEVEPRIKVLGIAGPGDPLANSATLATLNLAQREFPDLIKCTSTNGLALPAHVDALDKAGVIALTITINAVDPEIGGQIYPYVRYEGKTYRDREAFEILSRNQLEGLKAAAERGMVVKINSVLIPGVNDKHLVKVARVVKELGAHVMNIMPLIAQAKFKDVIPPSVEELNQVRDECAAILKQFRNCNQCRADAVGVPGEEGCSTLTPTTTNLCDAKFLRNEPIINRNSTND